MTTLNDTFERKLAQEDEGYESRSESLSIPTPLRKALQTYHISTSENMSFNPTTPLTTAEQHLEHSLRRFGSHSPVHHLVLTSSDDETPARTSDPHFQHCSPLQGRAEPLHHSSTTWIATTHPHQVQMTPSRDATAEEEDFPTAPIDDDIWLEDPVPERYLCIHEQSQPHYQCSYPCPYSLRPATFHSRR